MVKLFKLLSVCAVIMLGSMFNKNGTNIIPTAHVGHYLSEGTSGWYQAAMAGGYGYVGAMAGAYYGAYLGGIGGPLGGLIGAVVGAA